MNFKYIFNQGISNAIINKMKTLCKRFSSLYSTLKLQANIENLIFINFYYTLGVKSELKIHFDF